MFATDFLFDGQRASDFGCMICSFDGNGGLKTAEGGEIEYNAIKMPGRNKFSFCGSQFNSTVTWNFSICKNPCRKGNGYFDQYEESMIKKWLLKTDGYRMMQFDQNGYEDIYYNVYFNIFPYQYLGKTVGFDLTAISDCPYGFTDIIKKKAIITSMSKLELTVHSDVNAVILPISHIKIYYHNLHNTGRQVSITNKDSTGKPDKPMIFQNALNDTNLNAAIITIDSYSGVVNGLNNPNNFNWKFLKLRDGLNTITTDFNEGFVEIEIQYREPRHIII